jgi:hypothetical protein
MSSIELERLGLMQRLKATGAVGLVSRKRGAPSHRQMAPEIREMALALVRGRYADFGPTLRRRAYLTSTRTCSMRPVNLFSRCL